MMLIGRVYRLSDNEQQERFMAELNKVYRLGPEPRPGATQIFRLLNRRTGATVGEIDCASPRYDVRADIFTEAGRQFDRFLESFT